MLKFFARFGVILVFVCPMQQHFFTGVGHGISVAFIAALADKIAFVVITAEKGEQMAVNGGFVVCTAFFALLDFAAALDISCCFQCGTPASSNVFAAQLIRFAIG